MFGEAQATGAVLSARGLTTYYVLFFIELATRAVRIAGITTNPRKAGFFKSLAMSAMSMTVRYPKGRKLSSTGMPNTWVTGASSLKSRASR